MRLKRYQIRVTLNVPLCPSFHPDFDKLLSVVYYFVSSCDRGCKLSVHFSVVLCGVYLTFHAIENVSVLIKGVVLSDQGCSFERCD